MIDSTIDLLNAAKPLDSERLEEIFPAQQRASLLAAILRGSTTELTPAAPTPRRVAWVARLRGAPRRRRWLVSTLGASIAAGACAALVFAGSAVVHPSSAVAFSTAPGGDVIATVTDPFAAQKELNAAFAAHGFAITVALLPVSPSLVGTLISTSQDGPGSVIDPLQGGTCVSGGGGCPIGVKIPATFTGSGSITLGRPAQPGEPYDSTASAFAPGEALHCSGLLGKPVSVALPVLARDRVTVTSWRETVDGGGTGAPSASRTDATPPAQNYIWSADPVVAGGVSIVTAPTPLRADLVANGHRYDQGC